MCGIFGWLGTPPNSPHELVENAQRLLFHRGPDDGGFESGSTWGFVFRRLSILDLSPLGHQPMASPDGRFWMVFNGEIYNYIELRQTLEQQGETFVSTSDSEVLLCLLMLEGSAALSKLNGMFALAFVDTVENTFLLARDRLGQKPFYFLRQSGHLRFASELKALLAWPNAPRTLNPQAVVEYLGIKYLGSETCIFEEYEKLAPGHYLAGQLSEPQNAKISSYWQLKINGQEGPSVLCNNQQDELLHLIRDATQIRLRSDVPVGIFLSGGIDSGIVASMAGEMGNVDQLLALTVGFAEKRYDESSLAASVAKNSGLNHQIISVEPNSLDQLDRLAWIYDEPFGDESALPTTALCKAASEHATVFLAGDGGDEAFGGYNRYIQARKYRHILGLHPALQTGLRSLSNLLPTLSRHRYRLLKSTLPNAGFAAAFDEVAEDPVLKTVLSAEYAQYAALAGRPIWQRWSNIAEDQALVARQQLLDYDFYLPDDILVKMDRASMANSIEVRSPFLDYRLVEWAAALPRSVMLNTTEGKLPLRQVAGEMLPRQVQSATKRGFGVPLDSWFRTTEGEQLVRERLLTSDAPLQAILNPTGIEDILNAHLASSGRNWGKWLWRLLMLDAWARQYLSGKKFMEGIKIF